MCGVTYNCLHKIEKKMCLQVSSKEDIGIIWVNELKSVSLPSFFSSFFLCGFDCHRPYNYHMHILLVRSVLIRMGRKIKGLYSWYHPIPAFNFGKNVLSLHFFIVCTYIVLTRISHHYSSEARIFDLRRFL